MRVYAGLFLVSLATLAYEILLTRIFSVTMWYHYAFLAISVALFGMTVGAIAVYAFPGCFARGRTAHALAAAALLFAISSVVSLAVHLALPFDPGRPLGTAVWTYLATAVPFVASGIVASLALTRFPRRVSTLYAADLAGAACGCVALIYMLRVTDGPGAVLIVALCGSLGALCFAPQRGGRRLAWGAAVASILLVAAGSAQAILAAQQRPLVRLTWAKGAREPRALYERWNSFSRIRVSGDPSALAPPAGWGMSPRVPADLRTRQLLLTIDASAGTILPAFDGDVRQDAYLRFDITNLAFYLRHNARVLVVGSGGGRDVLSALTFGERSVTAVEINGDILDAVNRRFGDFTGHLDRDPRVHFVNDEARSYIARLRSRFDVIQISLIDTWAATSAGAFVLTENSLYTTDAWAVFLAHLSPHGVLSVTRWYFRDRPAEMYRLTALATASLRELGVDHPRSHLIVVRNMQPGGRTGVPDGLGTLLVSPEPFSDDDVRLVERVAHQMRFDVVLTPRAAADPMFAAIARGADLERLVARFPLNILPPTDDNPFFFHMLRLRDVVHPALWRGGEDAINMEAVSTLVGLLAFAIAMTLLCIIVPLRLTGTRRDVKGASPFLLFFAGIGLGFMLVEISQMQRLVVFLGHPTYGLSVVLFTVLLASGAGSALTRRIGRGAAASGAACLAVLLCVLGLFGAVTPASIRAFQSATTPLRVLVAIALLSPLGVCMGMAFPLGMRVASGWRGALTPWLWGINGAASVCASVLAVAISLGAGISASFWTGTACYVLATLAYIGMCRASATREPLQTVQARRAGEEGTARAARTTSSTTV